MSFFVWVKYADARAVEVDATACRNVDALIELVKKEIGRLVASSAAITLCLSSAADDGSVMLTALDPWAPVPVQQYANDGSPVPLIVQVSATVLGHISSDSKQQKTEHKWKTMEGVTSVTYNPQANLFELDSAYLSDSGLLLPDSGKLILYCRPTFHEQFKFLREEVMDNSRLGWILGPPGTGKSTTTLAFASTLDWNQWAVTWIHLSRRRYPVCMRLDGLSRKSREIKYTDIDELNDTLNEVEETKNHIVFIDGFTLSEKHIDFQMACYSWLGADKKRRRLVVVCAMSSRGKTNVEEDQMDNVEEFFVYSWTLKEYLSAVKNDCFFNSVQARLDSSSDLQPSETDIVQPSRIELVTSKFYFAGGCSRFMFRFPNAVVIKRLSDSVAAVPDIMPYIKGSVGDPSDAVVNRLFSSYHKPFGPSKNSHYTSIVSAWAASELAMKGGPDLIRNLAATLRLLRNPSMDGWMLEMWFFACIHKIGLKLRDRHGISTEWPACGVTKFDNIPLLPEGGIWLKPKK